MWRHSILAGRGVVTEPASPWPQQTSKREGVSADGGSHPIPFHSIQFKQMCQHMAVWRWQMRARARHVHWHDRRAGLDPAGPEAAFLRENIRWEPLRVTGSPAREEVSMRRDALA